MGTAAAALRWPAAPQTKGPADTKAGPFAIPAIGTLNDVKIHTLSDRRQSVRTTTIARGYGRATTRALDNRA